MTVKKAYAAGAQEAMKKLGFNLPPGLMQNPMVRNALVGAVPGAILGGLTAEKGQGLSGMLGGAVTGGVGGAALGHMTGRNFANDLSGLYQKHVAPTWNLFKPYGE